jgi:hypothetical protein
MFTVPPVGSDPSSGNARGVMPNSGTTVDRPTITPAPLQTPGASAPQGLLIQTELSQSIEQKLSLSMALNVETLVGQMLRGVDSRLEDDRILRLLIEFLILMTLLRATDDRAEAGSQLHQALDTRMSGYGSTVATTLSLDFRAEQSSSVTLSVQYMADDERSGGDSIGGTLDVDG